MGYRRFRRPLTLLLVARRSSPVARRSWGSCESHFAYLLYLTLLTGTKSMVSSPNRSGKENRLGWIGILGILRIPLCLLTTCFTYWNEIRILRPNRSGKDNRPGWIGILGILRIPLCLLTTYCTGGEGRERGILVEDTSKPPDSQRAGGILFGLRLCYLEIRAKAT